MDISELSNLMVKITQDRDEMAFSNLFDFLAPKINTYFLQNGLAAESAEELTQEVMSTIWAKSDKYDPSKSAVSTWVYTIARNKKIDFLRRNSKTKINEEDIRDFLYNDSESDKLKRDEIIDQVNRINQELTADQRKTTNY